MEYRILGPLEVLAAGGEKLALGGAMQQSVLGSLLLRAGQTVALERLIEQLWDEPPETAARTVQAYISRLRHELPKGAIESRPGGYRLELDGAAFDLEAFEQRAKEGHRALSAGQYEEASQLLRSGLALWRGPPLAGLTSDALRRQAERLEELRLTALEDRLEADLGCGREAETVPELKALVAEHPFRERLRAQLMRALSRSGRPGEALALYRETRRLLVEELGMEPGQELRELEQAILRQDAELAAHGRKGSTAPALPVPMEPEPKTLTDRRVGELPQGTVSLLFTDIEGSTQLQHRLGERYHEVVAEHRRLLEQAFAEHGGIVVDRQTESFFVVFTRARYALQAAAVAQTALAEHDWPDGVHVKVRMGIHSGDPEVAGDRYVGLAVARAARICAAAHGGQVLLSSSARALLSDHDRSALRSLGLHRLKDFEEPEPISQLIVDGLPSQFPPLRTEAASPRRRQLLLVAALVVAAGATAGVLLAFSSGGSSSLKIGPTSLAVIDPKSNKVVDAIDVGFKSNLIAAGEGAVWLVDPQGSTLVKINPATRKAHSYGIAVGAGSIPFGLAAGNGAVWVAVFRGSRDVVRELGPDVFELRRTIPYGGQTQAPPVLYRTNPLAVGDGAVWAIDPAFGGVWRIRERGKAREVADGLDAFSLAAGGGAVWVAGASVLTKLDAFTGEQLGSELVGSQGSADTASVAVDHRAVWYTASSQRTLWKLDPQYPSNTETFSIGKGPTGIAIGEGAVWVASSGDGTVTRLDSDSGASRTIRVGQAPGGVVAAHGKVWISPGEPRS